jgi:5-methylcytosine-specific restriction endonuclease McrA
MRIKKTSANTLKNIMLIGIRRNKENRQEQIRQRKKEKKAEWIAYKSTLECAHCGFSHPYALDFHHIDPKASDQKIYKLVSQEKYTAARKEAEANCIPLCANCHRIYHSKAYPS